MLIAAAFLSFISTNLDDLLMLILFFREADSPKKRVQILIGQYVGIFTLVFLSLLAAHGIAFLSERLLRLLGFVLIFLGIRALIFYFRPKKSNSPVVKAGIFPVALLAVSDGADNLGVYIPLLGGMTWKMQGITILIFTVMVPLWCLLAHILTKLPIVEKALHRFGNLLVGIVFLMLGLMVLL